MNRSYTILVNSSDTFDDCWPPFFHLFQTYWPGCEASVLLNTERKTHAVPGLNLRATQVQSPDEPRLTWSECFIRALAQVQTPLVLYFQEDYFLEAPVNVNFIDEMAHVMLAAPAIGHIGLTHFGSHGPFTPTSDDRLWQIGPRARYRISTQVGLWRKESLLRYLRPDENGWMFEIYGSRRATTIPETFLTTNRERFHPDLGSAIVQYTHTGIMKGRWHPAMPDLFARHGIAVDFSRRGFYHQPPFLLRKWQTLWKLASRPAGLLRK